MRQVTTAAVAAANSSCSSSKVIWIFGFGANMNVEHLNKQKGIQVLQHKRCVLLGYKLRFNLNSAYKKSEPVYANLHPSDDPEAVVHGVAFACSEHDAKKVDDIEVSYNRRPIHLRDYDGNEVEGFMYECKPNVNVSDIDGRPSARYLSLLVRGARAAGLQQDYIRRLLAVPVHQPEQQDVLRRDQLLQRSLNEFKQFSWEEAPQHTVSLYGYLFNIGLSWNKNLNSLHGKELSMILLRFYHGAGQLRAEAKSPFPRIDCVRILDPEGFDYTMTWIDTFLDIAGDCFGRLSGYQELCCDSLDLPQPIVYPQEELACVQ